jgi:hypothetical protein
MDKVVAHVRASDDDDATLCGAPYVETAGMDAARVYDCTECTEHIGLGIEAASL